MLRHFALFVMVTDREVELWVLVYTLYVYILQIQPPGIWLSYCWQGAVSKYLVMVFQSLAERAKNNMHTDCVPQCNNTLHYSAKLAWLTLFLPYGFNPIWGYDQCMLSWVFLPRHMFMFMEISVTIWVFHALHQATEIAEHTIHLIFIMETTVSRSVRCTCMCPADDFIFMARSNKAHAHFLPFTFSVNTGTHFISERGRRNETGNKES